MRDQPSRGCGVEGLGLDEVERVVLELLLTGPVPGLWSVRELALQVGGEVEVVDAVAGLQAAGLIHRVSEFVFPTRAAVRFNELAEAG